VFSTGPSPGWPSARVGTNGRDLTSVWSCCARPCCQAPSGTAGAWGASTSPATRVLLICDQAIQRPHPQVPPPRTLFG